MNILKQINRDKEIQEMRNFIHENTREWPNLWFWDGETIEKYREMHRAADNVDEIVARYEKKCESFHSSASFLC